MPHSWEFALTASILINAPAHVSFDFMADGIKQAYWALGSWDRRVFRDDIFVGTSLFNNSESYVRLVSHNNLKIVDYHCGVDPDDLKLAVQARIIDGWTLGVGKEKSIITLTAWRGGNTSDEEWGRTEHVWQTEIHLIKGRIEIEYRER